MAIFAKKKEMLGIETASINSLISVLSALSFKGANLNFLTIYWGFSEILESFQKELHKPYMCFMWTIQSKPYKTNIW